MIGSSGASDTSQASLFRNLMHYSCLREGRNF
jgi:hypothetical protein